MIGSVYHISQKTFDEITKSLSYEGNAPYIFISYSHKDSDRVMPAISELQSAGYKVWYDAGIKAGSKWPDYIANRLSNSALVILFISAASIDSQYCSQELTFAQSLKKPILSVILDETPIPLGMQMQLCNHQSLIAYRHNSIESYVKELCSAPYLAEVLNLNKH
jgi:hypothetical protein